MAKMRSLILLFAPKLFHLFHLLLFDSMSLRWSHADIFREGANKTPVKTTGSEANVNLLLAAKYANKQGQISLTR